MTETATGSGDGVERTRTVEWRGLIAVAGLGATALTAWGVARSPTFGHPTGTALWRAAFVGSYVAVGGYTWWRRRESRLGPLVAAAGFLYSVASLNASGAALPYTIGMVVWAAVIVFLAYVFLCFPQGRLGSGLERGFVLGYAASTALVWALILILSPTLPPGGPFTDCGTHCPPNALQIIDAPAATGAALNVAFSVVSMISLIVLAMLIFHKARASASARRRSMTPLAIAFIANIVEFVLFLLVGPAYPATQGAFRIADGVVTLAVPAAMLVGQVRGDVFAAKSLGQLALRASGERLTPADVQNMIRDALDDSMLTLALWDSERAEYIDVDGVPVEPARDTRARAATGITRSGQPVAVLIHDPAVDTDSVVVEGLAATSLLLLENSRLVGQLRESRARLVDTAEHERRRIEMDLHDGAQQRLVEIQIRLSLARELADRDDLIRQLDGAQQQADAALQELRALAQGIYPAGLNEFGPAVALRALTQASSLAVQVRDDGLGRSSRAIEAALYFCAREAIQNATKHAGARAVTVTLARHEGVIEFTVSDDGGGIPPEASANGMGITGMRDRIEAVGGQLEIISSPRRGTMVHGTIPHAAPPRPVAGRL
ncbi:MAG TPA: ATP-binding protein [Solirubrobacteraceae bacterium]|nr:ATP-binding protein [Solirubrobacteraceae bacterium]